MQRYEAKIVSLFIIFGCILGAMLLPIRVAGAIARRGERGRLVLGGISCFSGGIFLATYLLDMAPEVRALLEDTLLRPHNIAYPLPEFIIGTGFFFILVVELAVTAISRRRHEAKKRPLRDNKVDVTVEMDAAIENADKKQAAGSVETETVVDSTGVEPTGTYSRDAEKASEFAVQDEESPADNPSTDTSAIVAVDKNGDLLQTTGFDNQAFASPANNMDKTSKASTTEVIETDAADNESDVGHHHATRSIILVLALSLDSVFEGMAVGLRTTMQGVWSLTIAIVAHEVVIAFGMGMQLLKTQTRRTVVGIALVYSIMSPIGGAIGTLLMETQGRSTNMDLTNGVLQGITAGIFIYVTFFEILNDEFSNGVNLMRLATTLLGFVVMATLKAIPDGTDDSGHVTMATPP
ncbi:hypothetical protein LSAT2_010668 [Lamellibrachia satsuma]|nr:hypothetical protein LSAT2_010668 [Lamellibrachia satsuma]